MSSNAIQIQHRIDAIQAQPIMQSRCDCGCQDETFYIQEAIVRELKEILDVTAPPDH